MISKRKLPPDLRRRGPRHGYTLVVVMALLAIALATSYAMLRTQLTSAQIQGNTRRKIEARQAAMTGIAVGLRKLHETSWQGVGTSFSSPLTQNDSFQVAYAAGDSSLSEGDADYDRLPYRVTVTSTGYSTDPANNGNRSSYVTQVVVELDPGKLSPEPTDWTQFLQYTLWQGGDKEMQIELPCRIEGRVRSQGRLRVAEAYPDRADVLGQYLWDLGLMLWFGRDDYRPFDGPVHLNATDNASATTRLPWMGVVAQHHSRQPFSSDWSKPSSMATYQIYPGGPEYQIEPLPNTLQDTSLEPSALTNPLGIFYCDSPLEIRDNVSIHGTLFVKDDVTVRGTNLLIRPVDLMPLRATTAANQLPALTCKSFIVEPGATGAITGLVAVFNNTNFKPASVHHSFSITGRMIVSNELHIQERTEWENVDWPDAYDTWLASGPYTFLPEFMRFRGLSHAPAVLIRPDPSDVAYHWHRQGNPVYDVHDSVVGLQWEVLRWEHEP